MGVSRHPTIREKTSQAEVQDEDRPCDSCPDIFDSSSIKSNPGLQTIRTRKLSKDDPKHLYKSEEKKCRSWRLWWIIGFWRGIWYFWGIFKFWRIFICVIWIWRSSNIFLYNCL